MSTILITGAAGSLGRELTRKLSEEHTIRAFDSHESGLAALKGDNVRLMLGDINDLDRLRFAMNGCDVCIHTASYKNIDTTEYSLEQCFQTNIFGTINVAKACFAAGVKKAVLVSSDKAVNPVSAYGISKNAQERVWLWAAKVFSECDFITGRFGNFIGSSGSCFEVWDRQMAEGKKITVTHPNATRYFIEIDDVVGVIAILLNTGKNGKIYMPPMAKLRIYDLAISHTGCTPERILFTGLRDGEKMHEQLCSGHSEKAMTADGGYLYVL